MYIFVGMQRLETVGDEPVQPPVSSSDSISARAEATAT